VNKYREGKMKRTLKRESKACEIAARETFEQPVQPWAWNQPTCLCGGAPPTPQAAGCTSLPASQHQLWAGLKGLGKVATLGGGGVTVQGAVLACLRLRTATFALGYS